MQQLSARWLLLAIGWLISYQSIFAQGTSCAGADPFCSGSGATFPAGVNQPAATPGNNYGCLGSQPNPAWYYLQIANPGNITINLTNSNNVDVDFILWGPFPNIAAATAGCGSLGNNGTGGGIVDCSFSGAANEFVDINGAATGQVYILLITNFSNQNTNILATTAPNSTASTNCSILLPCAPARFQDITVGNPYDCTGPNVTLTASPSTTSPGNLSITPGFQFSINTDANSGVQNTLQIFDGPNGTGNVIAYWGPTNNGGAYQGAIPNSSNFQGTIEYLDTTVSYSLVWCDAANTGTFTTLITNSGSNTILRNTPLNGASGCTTVNLNQPDGFPLFFGPGVLNNRNGSGLFSPSAAGAGIHTVSYLWRSPAGCIDTAEQTVIVCCNNPPAPLINSSVTSVCPSQTASLTATAPSISSSTTTFTNNTQATIPIRASISSTIDVQGVCPLRVSNGVIQSVCVNIDQSLTRHINLTLIAPDGTRMDLSSGNGGFTSQRYRNTCFSPTAATNITTFNAATAIPDNSSFLPEQNFSVLNGRPVDGVWTLEIVHTTAAGLGGNNGTLRGWSINFAPAATSSNTYSWAGPNMSCTNCQSPTVSPTVTSVYNVTATTPCGCTFIDAQTITVASPFPAPSNLVCTSTTSDINFTWDEIPGVAGYEVSTDGGTTWLPYNGITPTLPNHSFSGLALNQTINLAVRATGGGCPSSSSTTSCTTLNCPLTITLASSTNVSCNAGTDGTASFNLAASQGALTYQITSPVAGATQSSDIFTGLSAGNYIVSASDATLACGVSLPFTITEPSAVSATLAGTSTHNGFNITCNGVLDGAAAVAASGGTPTYTYIWSDGQTNSSATGLAAGGYTVTVADINACSTTFSVTLTEPSPLTLTTSSLDVTCFAGTNGSGTVTASGSAGTYQYLWDNGSTTANVTGLGAGSYCVTVQDVNSCVSVACITINQPSASVSVSAASTPSLCAGNGTGTATATAIGGTGVYNYNWSINASSQQTATATGLIAGNYTVTATDGNGCAAATTVIVGDASGLSVSTAAINASCNGVADGTATVNASGGAGGFVFVWSNNQTGATATGLAANNYCVTATDLNGCAISSCVVVNEPQGMSAPLFAVTGVSCFGGSDGRATASLTGGVQPYTFRWDNNTQGATGTGFNAGNHVVTITDANGCTITATVLIPQPIQLQTTLTADSVLCRFGNTGRISSVTTGGTAPYSYLWSNGQNTANNNNLTAGNYSLLITDLNGCTITASASVGQPISAVIANIINTQNVACNGGLTGVLEVNGTGGTPNYSYLWSNGQTNSNATGLGTGSYNVTITDQRGCTASANGLITAPSALVANASVFSNYNGADISCTNEDDGSARVLVSGGQPNYGYLWSTIPAQNTAVATGLAAGSYTVTVTDQAGCALVRTVILRNPSTLAASENHVDVFCHNGNTGQIVVTATPGTGTLGINGYEYAIFGPNQNGNIFSANNQYFGLVAGTYTVIVRDGNNCTLPVSIQITEPAALSISIASTDALCNGGATGTANATVLGGISPYTYAWSNGQANQIATGLISGGYSVTATDANGCDIARNVIINQPTAVTATVTPQSVSCNGGSNGTATVAAAGGVSPYRFRWSNNSTAAVVNGLFSGNYSVTITDSQGCTNIQNFVINEPTGLTASVSGQNLTCANSANGAATANPLGGTAPYSFVWNNGQTNQTATGLSAGIQQVTVRDANGCQTTARTTLSQPALVTAQISAATATNCANSSDGTATAQGAGGTAPYSYLWSNGQTSQTATGLSANQAYFVTVTDANACNSAISTSIPNPSAISISNTTGTDVLCKNEATGRAIVFANGGTLPYNYQWSNAQTTAVATGLAAGLYSVTVSDSRGCNISAQVQINEPAQSLSMFVNQTPTLCEGGATGQAVAVPGGGTPLAANNYNYRWSNGETTRGISGLLSGTYSVTVTDANGCTISQNTQVTDGGTVLANTQLLQTPTCDGGSDGRITGSGSTSNGGNVSYLWSNGATFQTLSGLAAGTYYLVVTDTAGCSATDSVVVPNGLIINASATIQDVLCFAQSNGAINVTSQPNGIIYEWSNGFVAVDGSISNLAAGDYTVTITSAQGCRQAFDFQVSQPDSFAVALNVNQDISCYLGSNGEIAASVNGGTPNYSFVWSNSSTDNTINNLSAGGYSIIVTDANGCTATAATALSEPNELDLALLVTGTTCSDSQDGEIVMTATGGTLNLGLYEFSLDQIEWQTGDIFPNLAADSLIVFVRDADGCVDSAAAVIEAALPFFIVSATADTTMDYLDSLTLQVLVNDSVGVNTFWTLLSATGGVLDSNVYQLLIMPTDAAVYQFTATNINGCVVDTTIQINVNKARNANAPKGFSPNGDGNNDTFFIQGDDKIEKINTFRVYDRWGELVYEVQNVQPNDASQGWNGTFKGQNMNSGVFVWYAEIKYRDGFVNIIKGDVTLLR